MTGLCTWPVMMVAWGGGIGRRAANCLAPVGASDMVASGRGGSSCIWGAKMISFAGIGKERDAGDRRNVINVPRSIVSLWPVMGSKGLTNIPKRAVGSVPSSVSQRAKAPSATPHPSKSMGAGGQLVLCSDEPTALAAL